MPIYSSCGRATPEGFPRCANCGALLDAAPVAIAEERTIVSVLFCDLVGFSAASEAVDPEDVRARLRPYHQGLRVEIERYGGTVEKFVATASRVPRPSSSSPPASAPLPERTFAAPPIRGFPDASTASRWQTDWVSVATATRVELVSGNRLTALGALSAGCRFFAGYPITPSSEIFRTMMAELPRRGGLGLSAPDEISALTACVGASLAGHPAMTATSGPGFCLMIETIQYAVMTETPVVIALVQRLGPSTGGATQGAQGDVLLAEFCTSGGYTIPVFAPATAADCWHLTRRAFEWSERLRTPVVVLSDKEVGMTSETVDLAALAGPPVVTRTGLPRRRLVVTGSAHDREGRLRKPNAEVVEVLAGLRAKVAANADEMSYAHEELDADADVLVVSYGVSARAVLEACRRVRAGGGRVSFLGVQTLFPVPERVLARALGRSTRVVVVEENATGLYAGALEPHLGGRILVRVNAVGAMVTPARIVAAIEAKD